MDEKSIKSYYRVKRGLREQSDVDAKKLNVGHQRSSLNPARDTKSRPSKQSSGRKPAPTPSRKSGRKNRNASVFPIDKTQMSLFDMISKHTTGELLPDNSRGCADGSLIVSDKEEVDQLINTYKFTFRKSLIEDQLDLPSTPLSPGDKSSAETSCPEKQAQAPSIAPLTCDATPKTSLSRGNKLVQPNSLSSLVFSPMENDSCRRLLSQASTLSSSPLSINAPLGKSSSCRSLRAQSYVHSSSPFSRTVSPSKSPHGTLPSQTQTLPGSPSKSPHGKLSSQTETQTLSRSPLIDSRSPSKSSHGTLPSQAQTLPGSPSFHSPSPSKSPHGKLPSQTQAQTLSGSPSFHSCSPSKSPHSKLPSQTQTLPGSPSFHSHSPSACPHGKLPSQGQAQTPASSPSSHNLSPSKSFSCGRLVAKVQSSCSRSQFSQSVSPQKNHSRGMLLVQLAQQKGLAKSPTSRNIMSKNEVTLATGGKVEDPCAIKRTARRKLHLEPSHGPGEGVAAAEASSSRLPSRCPKVLGLRTKPDGSLQPGQELTYPSTSRRRMHRSTPDLEKTAPKFDAFEFDSPVKSDTLKASPITVAARSDSCEYPLPKSYQKLAELFRCADVVVDMLRKRKEICTFSKLKKAVEQMSNIQFTMKSFGQMSALYSQALNYHYEKNLPGDYDKRSCYQLIIESNLGENGLVTCFDRNRNLSHLSTASLVYRRKTFNERLRSSVMSHHRQFLAGLNPPVQIPDELVFRWHCDFCLDSVPEIEGDLPTPPTSDVCVTAKGLLSMQHARVSELAKKEGEGREGEGKAEVAAEKQPAACPGYLKDIPQELIEKIRAKETARAVSNITRDPEKTKMLRMLDIGPSIIRIIKTYFVLEKKAAIPLCDVVRKVKESHPSHLSEEFIEQTISTLASRVSSSMNILTVRRKKYLKLQTYKCLDD